MEYINKSKLLTLIEYIAIILFVAALIVVAWSYYNPDLFNSGAGYVALIVSYCIIGIPIFFALALLSPHGGFHL